MMGKKSGRPPAPKVVNDRTPVPVSTRSLFCIARFDYPSTWRPPTAVTMIVSNLVELSAGENVGTSVMTVRRIEEITEVVVCLHGAQIRVVPWAFDSEAERGEGLEDLLFSLSCPGTYLYDVSKCSVGFGSTLVHAG